MFKLLSNAITAVLGGEDGLFDLATAEAVLQELVDHIVYETGPEAHLDIVNEPQEAVSGDGSTPEVRPAALESFHPGASNQELTGDGSPTLTEAEPMLDMEKSSNSMTPTAELQKHLIGPFLDLSGSADAKAQVFVNAIPLTAIVHPGPEVLAHNEDQLLDDEVLTPSQTDESGPTWIEYLDTTPQDSTLRDPVERLEPVSRIGVTVQTSLINPSKSLKEIIREVGPPEDGQSVMFEDDIESVVQEAIAVLPAKIADELTELVQEALLECGIDGVPLDPLHMNMVQQSDTGGRLSTAPCPPQSSTKKKAKKAKKEKKDKKMKKAAKGGQDENLTLQGVPSVSGGNGALEPISTLPAVASALPPEGLITALPVGTPILPLQDPLPDLSVEILTPLPVSPEPTRPKNDSPSSSRLDSEAPGSSSLTTDTTLAGPGSSPLLGPLALKINGTATTGPESFSPLGPSMLVRKEEQTDCSRVLGPSILTGEDYEFCPLPDVESSVLTERNQKQNLKPSWWGILSPRQWFRSTKPVFDREGKAGAPVRSQSIPSIVQDTRGTPEQQSVTMKITPPSVTVTKGNTASRSKQAPKVVTVKNTEALVATTSLVAVSPTPAVTAAPVVSSPETVVKGQKKAHNKRLRQDLDSRAQSSAKNSEGSQTEQPVTVSKPLKTTPKAKKREEAPHAEQSRAKKSGPKPKNLKSKKTNSEEPSSTKTEPQKLMSVPPSQQATTAVKTVTQRASNQQIEHDISSRAHLQLATSSQAVLPFKIHIHSTIEAHIYASLVYASPSGPLAKEFGPHHLVMWTDATLPMCGKRLQALSVVYRHTPLVMGEEESGWQEWASTGNLQGKYGRSINILEATAVHMALGLAIGEVDRCLSEPVEGRVNIRKVTIFTDSQSTLTGLLTGKLGALGAIIVKYAEVLVSKGIVVDLRWVPSHAAVPGNEAADKLALLASRFGPVPQEGAFIRVPVPLLRICERQLARTEAWGREENQAVMKPFLEVQRRELREALRRAGAQEGWGSGARA